KLYEENNDKINQEGVLTARLLDMFIGDFDRHADQWKWGTEDTGIGKLYIAVPRDRDQAFFNSNGLLLKYLSRQRMRFLQGFKKNIPDIKGLNFVARDFDRVFLNGIEADTWKAVTDSFIFKLTDTVIDSAVANYPEAVKPLIAESIAAKLKSRRQSLSEKSLKYYEFISREVTVTGSNEEEYFHLSQDNKNLKLSVYRKELDNDSSLVSYRRSFDPAVTKELRLFGLNGNDKFVIDPDVSSPIKLRIIGGKGEDSFNLQGNVKNFLYDLSTEKNVLINTRKTNKELLPQVSVLDYKSNGFQYNQLNFPMFNLGFNSEDGLLLGLGLHARTYGFRKDPYKTDQRLTTLITPTNGNAYQLKYRGEFNRVISKNDVLFNVDLVNPTLNNFFGLGNDTEFNTDLGVQYYRVRYKYVETDLLIRKRFNDLFSISVGPTYYHYWDNYEDNKNRILGDPGAQGLDSASIYSPKSYLGVKAKLDIVYIDNEVFPSRGITWFTEFRAVEGLNNNSGDLSRIVSDMTIYAKVSDISRISTVLRFGGGRIFNDKTEYFQALNLGVNNYLRGYFKNRFSGSGMLYGSAELRYRLFKSKSAILPGDVGLMGFFDIGKVWVNNLESKKWHNSVGGGVYFVPFNLIMLSASLAVSEESRLFNFTVGTKFNLTF
ncbi:MAG: metallophosphoesterase, partial [Gloeobacteraceae cyanobacterium ES-bin-316]|nr:metallophosphoesterase [Ferruginibacter sp.]